MVSGQTYLIRVAGNNYETGNYTLLITPPPPPPSDNDDCGNAIIITEEVAAYGNTSQATGTALPNGNFNDPNDVWYRYTPSINGLATISLCGSDFDTTLAIFNSCDGNSIASNNDSPECEEQSEISLNVTQGTTYYIRIAGLNQATGNYILYIPQLIPHPVNDECSNAIDIIEEQTYSGSMLAVTGNISSTCNILDDANDLWYRYTPTLSGDVTVSLCGSQFDTTLSIYFDCNGSEWLCNDNACGLQSEIEFFAHFGTTYLIRIARVGFTTENYELYVSAPIPPPPPPVNDLCSNATVIAEDVVYAGSTQWASGNPLVGTDYNYNDPNDVWYAYSPSRTGRTTVSLCNSQFDTTLAFLDSCNGTLLYRNNDRCGLQSELFPEVTLGNNYLIRVSGYNGATGDYSLMVSEPILPPTYDDCNDAIVVSEGVFEGSSLLADGSDITSCSLNDANDVWHSYTPTFSGQVSISVCGSDFNANLAVFDSCGGNQLACNDRGCASQSEIILSVTSGQTYLIRVAGRNYSTGHYSLTISGNPLSKREDPDVTTQPNHWVHLRPPDNGRAKTLLSFKRNVLLTLKLQ